MALVAVGKPILFDSMDPDCFWHLRVAQQLRAEGIGPLVDHLSFASLPQPWTPYSWLAELGMQWLWSEGGWRAAILAQSMMQGAFIGLIALACRSSGWPGPRGQYGLDGSAMAPPSDASAPTPLRAGYMESGLVTAVAALLSLPYLSFRPVTAALVLLAVCAWLLNRDRRAGERSAGVWWIVPITALMVNIHLYAVFVPMWVGALLLGAAWERRAASPEDRIETERRLARYGWLLAGTSAACLMTPMLPGVVATALHYQYADPMVASTFIAEMQPFYHGTSGLIAAGAVLVLTGFMILSRRKLRAGDWAWFALSAVLLLRLGRFAPVFAIAAAPMFARTMPRFSGRVMGSPVGCALMAIVLVAGAVRIGIAFPGHAMTLSAWLNRHGPDAPGYPCAAADFVATHVKPSAGRIINEFTWGGYLEWRLGDSYETLLDGRTQLFSPAFWRVTYLGSSDARERYLTRLRADAAVLPAHDSKFRDVLKSHGWRVAYQDPEHRAQVLLPPPGMNHDDEPQWPFASVLMGE